MEKLTVDPEGRITIPAELIERRRLRPAGDELTLRESAEGLLLYHGGVDKETLEWWSSLSDEGRKLAEAEARRYESLSDAEREALWNEGSESIEAESDEMNLPAQ